MVGTYILDDYLWGTVITSETAKNERSLRLANIWATERVLD
jgi:hypothetical protein